MKINVLLLLILLKGRALCSHSVEVETVRFYVGTLGTRTEGQIHQIDFEDDCNQLSWKVHKPKVGDIWYMQSSPDGKSLGIVYNNISGTT